MPRKVEKVCTYQQGRNNVWCQLGSYRLCAEGPCNSIMKVVEDIQSGKKPSGKTNEELVTTLLKMGLEAVLSNSSN